MNHILYFTFLDKIVKIVDKMIVYELICPFRMIYIILPSKLYNMNISIGFSTLKFFIISLFVFSSCQTTEPKKVVDTNYFESREIGVRTGGIKMIPIQSDSFTFTIWTKTIGHNAKARVLLLNGGPGATHEYFECFESFLPKENIEFIYYDQLGCGNSDNPKDTAMWDLNRYVEEVEQVRIALGLDQSNFYLLGHSWGGILAMQYSLKYQQHLKGLIISNMMSDAVAYDNYADEVLSKQMDPVILTKVRAIEAKKDYQNTEYMELLMAHFYTKHILRMPLDQWPEPVNRSFSKINQSLYVIMQGPSEFGLSGKLENWNVFDKLKTITIPTLVIGAKNDTMDPLHMEKMSKEISKGEYLYCPNGSHMCMYDDQEIYFKGLIQFLKKTM